MKICPECSKEAEDTFDFCLDDGVKLLNIHDMPTMPANVSPKGQVISTGQVLHGLDEAMAKFKQLVTEHQNIRALVICTDQITEFLRKQKADFFRHRSITFLVLNESGLSIGERENEIKRMSSREVSDYNVRGAIRSKLDDLKTVNESIHHQITVKQYDLFPILEVWFFDDDKAIWGLVEKTRSTTDQKFIFCTKESLFFRWLQRYYGYVDRFSIPDKTFTKRHIKKPVEIPKVPLVHT